MQNNEDATFNKLRLPPFDEVWKQALKRSPMNRVPYIESTGWTEKEWQAEVARRNGQPPKGAGQ